MGKKAAPAVDGTAFLDRITSGKTKREYRGKEVVFSQGDPGDAVFFVESGRVKLTVVSTRGKEAVIGVMERGSFFGEGCLAGQALRMYTASAIQRATIVRLGRTSMVGPFRERLPSFVWQGGAPCRVRQCCRLFFRSQFLIQGELGVAIRCCRVLCRRDQMLHDE